MQEWSIAELGRKMDSGELTARQLAEMYLSRIALVDEGEDGVNSIIELNPDALVIAEELDVEREAGKVRGPLHGIPVLIKDNIDTFDRMTTTAGSLALEGSIALQDAFLVERLREAGVLILGKTNLSEWANFRGKRSTSGWSSRGGLTRNPYALDRTACGSSSGSAAAVAANLCAAAIGTETDGSIICPAQTNGVVGLKPTVGLISRTGIVPIAHSQDTAGPLARNVVDVAALLGALTSVDETDAATLSEDRSVYDDYTQFLDPQGLKGARIGVARRLFGTDRRVLKIIESNLETMKSQGAELIEVELASSDKFGKSEVEVLTFEFKADLNAYLANRGRMAQVHSLEEVIKFNEENLTRVLPYFGHERMQDAQKKGPLTQKKYINALEKNHHLTRDEGIDAVMAEHKLDAIVCPSGGPAWMIDLVNGDGGRSWDMDSTSYAAVAGYPHITVPAGYIFGLPVGISFFAGAWQEPTLIRLAYAFEQATQIRVPPQFLPTADFSL
ncbi:MAG: amidase [Anaerolineales bacterium]|jgi:amidase